MAENTLDLTVDDLKGLSRAAIAEIKALLSIKQTILDVGGSYPVENVLPYQYSFCLTGAQSTAVAANSTAQASISISADSAFVATQIVGASTGDYLVFTRLDASDRQLMNEPQHSAAYVGTAERPHYLAKPLLAPANTTLSYDLTDLSGAVNEIYYAMHGYKIYRNSYVERM